MTQRTKVGLLGAALGAGALGIVTLAQDPAERYDQAITHGATFLAQKSEDGKTLRLVNSTLGTINEVTVVGPIKVTLNEAGTTMRIEFAGAPSPEPSQEPSPSDPPPTDPPPSPGDCPYGADVEGKCLAKPPQLSCLARPDDPPGLMREGFGCDSKGGSGTGIIRVTALGPDGAQGTLRWAYLQADATRRRIVFDPLVGDVVLNTPLYWNKPYTTIDASAADISVVAKNKGTNALVFTATHDLIVYSGRGRGHWKPDPQYRPVNNAGNFTLDGDGGPTQYAWDDQWGATSPVLRRGVRSSLFDRNALSGCEDDCLASWEGVRDVSFTRNFVHDSFHPGATGAKGTPLPAGRERLRISWLYNVAARNGERNIAYPREETYWWVVARNIFFGWRNNRYFDVAKNIVDSQVSVGLHISDMYRNENDYGWIVANAFIPETDHQNWGVTIGEKLGCEKAPVCCAPNCTDQSGKNVACCNPLMKNTHWWFDANEGPLIEAVTNPPGYNPSGPLTLPFAIDKTRPWSQVLAEVGPVRRNAAEQALINIIDGKI